MKFFCKNHAQQYLNIFEFCFGILYFDKFGGKKKEIIRFSDFKVELSPDCGKQSLLYTCMQMLT